MSASRRGLANIVNRTSKLTGKKVEHLTTRKAFIAELNALIRKLKEMGVQLEEMIRQTYQALMDIDENLAKKIVQDDDIIDDMEREIEKICIRIVAKQQPVATDLRRVTSIMRMISDIERIADHCGDISEYIIDLAQEIPIATPKGIPEMMKCMQTMVTKTLDSFLNENLDEVERIVASDNIVDDYFERIKDELCIAMKKNPDAMKSYMDYLLIIKYIERMADHSVNIAEWNAFVITGDLEQYMNN